MPQLDDVFSILVDNRTVTLSLSKRQAASLRVSLIRKFQDYKKQMGAFGFLDDDLATSVVSLEWSDDVASFFLRPPKKRQIEYTIL